MASCVGDPPIPPPIEEEDAGTDASIPDPCASPDGDGDGHGRIDCDGDDCSDVDATIYPGAPDDVGDDVDQSCDGTDGIDADGDGHASTGSGGDDCDDGHAEVNPDAVKVEGEDWVLDVPDEGDTGGTPSIVIDDADVAHILYYDIPQGVVRYIDDAAGTWSVPELVDDERYFQYTNLAVHDGVLHAVYQGWGADGTTSIHYARKDPGGAWEIQMLAEGWGMVFPKLAVAPEGVVHVVWADWGGIDSNGTYAVQHATDESGDMVVDTVQITDNRSFDSEIAVDGDGVPHVLYSRCMVHTSCYSGEDRQIRYASLVDGAWEVEDLTDGASFIPFTTLAMDGDGFSHIAWGGDRNEDLVYTTNSSGGWVSRSVESGGWTGVDPSIAVDAEGYVGISFLDWSIGAGALMFLSNRIEEFGVARPVTVDLRGTGAFDDSLAFDSRGSPHIAYFNSDEWYLGYAHTDGFDENCDGVDW